MHSLLKTIIVLLLLVSAGPVAFAEEYVTPISWYGRVSMGFAAQTKKYVEVNHGQYEWDFESGLNFGAALGYTVPYLALEGEFTYRRLDVVRRINTSGGSVRYTGDQTQVSLMLNAYYIPKPDWQISPYIGLGIGSTAISWNDVRPPGGPVIDDSDAVFSYQLIAGASYKINPYFTVMADYRYFVPGDVEMDMNGDESQLTNQELNIVGLSLRFKL